MKLPYLPHWLSCTPRHICLGLLLVLLGGCAGLTTEKRETIKSLERDVQSTLQKVQEKIRDNPESALDESISMLDSILDYTEAVKADPDKFSQEKIQAYIDRINIINENIERFKDVTLKMDVSFPLGRYQLKHLSEFGKQEGSKLVERIMGSLQELLEKYPERNIGVTLKVTGYTDETGFTEDTALEKMLRDKLGDKLPKDYKTRRIVYNRELSKLRAASLAGYMVERLKERLQNNPRVKINSKVIGRGEVVPNRTPETPYRAKDARRRICVISPLIEIVL